MSTTSGGLSLLDVPLAQLNIAQPLAYGNVIAVGNVLIQQQLANKKTVAFVGLGEGEWDGIERFWINRNLIDASDDAIIHFHPGIEGTIGAGLAPTSLGGDQGVDEFFTLLPAAIKQVTYSRTAYIAMLIAPDPKAPSSTIEWLGHYRAMKVRKFDAAGNQTDYAFSTNTAEQIIDVMIRTILKREGLKGEALTAAEKSRIDFGALAESVAFCDELLANGKKRFETGFAFVQQTQVSQVLKQMLTACRCYMNEVRGVITLTPDKPRGVSFTIKARHLASSTDAVRFAKTNLRTSNNRVLGSYRDPNPQNVAEIATITRTGGGAATVDTLTESGVELNDNIELVDPLDPSFSALSRVTQIFSSTSFYCTLAGAAGATTGGYVGLPETRFTQRGPIVDHEAHQKAIGQRGLGLAASYRRNPIQIDFGVSSEDQVTRQLNYLLVRSLGVDQAAYQAPFEGTVKINLDGVDDDGNIAAGLLPGDWVAIDESASEEFQGTYEVMQQSATPVASDNSGDGSTTELSLLEVVPEALDESPATSVPLGTGRGGGGLTPITQVDANGNQIVGISTPLNPQGSVLPGQTVAFSVSGVTYDAGTGKYSATISWPSTDLVQCDQSLLHVPAGSLVFTTVLNTLTTYYCYMRVATTGGAISIGSGDPPIVPPSAPNAGFAMACNYDGYQALGIVKITTGDAAGSGVSSDDPSICVEYTEPVETLTRGFVRVGFVQPGEMIADVLPDGTKVWRKVLSNHLAPCSSWRRILGYLVSPTDEVEINGRRMRAYEASDVVVEEPSFKAALTLQAENDDGRWYLVGNELRVHNAPIICA